MQNFLETVSLPLFAADFDYFRLPPPQWELMLIRLKQMGTNLVTITLPWGFHEIEPGMIDLEGTTTPRRDVVGALKLCHQLDMPCLLGIGPYHPQEVLNDGLPRWISTHGEDETGFTAAVESWYQGVSARLTGWQWPDGPIIAVRLGLEAVGPQRPTLSKQLTEVRWPIWLRKRYDSIEALNEAYEADYRTVNEVTFPASWAEAMTTLEIDAGKFIAEVRAGVRRRYTQTLLEAGWQTPIYPPAAEAVADLPTIQPYTLADIDELSPAETGGKIFNLRQPIQVQPNPADIGLTPAWATNAPIRADGSLRRAFWRLRRLIWLYSLPEINYSNGTLVAIFGGITLASCASDTPLKLDVPPNTKPVTYRLRTNGDLFIDETFSVRRKKLTGLYLAEDEADQTDLLLTLTDPTIPLTDFPRTYLASLLAGQTETLARSAWWVDTLAKVLALPSAPAAADQAPTRHPKQTLNTLEEARRGLREADIALRKAMSSIGGLELGFSTILDKDQTEMILPPAPASATISPVLFEGPAREILLEIGRLCTELVPSLEAAVTGLRQILDTPEKLTVEQYRHGYNQAIASAQQARQPLLDTISRLRRQINAETLPLVLWPVHDRLQNIAELLRWGVMRR